MKLFFSILLVIKFCICTHQGVAQSNTLVFQSDFGVRDGAVAAMKGVAFSVSTNLKIFDITHEIPAFNIWEAAYRLNQTASYWPVGTVFVSVVDPGVGSTRRSIVLKTKSGHYFVSPDNGTLTLISENLGIEDVREIDETVNRVPGSNASYTFHGRDVYAFTGARLAAGIISFSDVGGKLKSGMVLLPYQKAKLIDNVAKGTIDVLDVQYGNVWTNIPQSVLKSMNLTYGNLATVKIFFGDELKYESEIVFGETFSAVKEGQPIGYLNSLLNFSLGINMGNFAAKFGIDSGPEWTILVSKKN